MGKSNHQTVLQRVSETVLSLPTLLTSNAALMPLPSTAFTLTGGCNCRSIRYRISIPELSARPLHPYSNPSAPDPQNLSSTLPPVHLPYTFTDHCNDCRRATASILPAWITTHISTVTVSLLPASASPSQRAADDNARPAYEAGVNDLTDFDSAAPSTAISHYASSPGVRRSFCGMCGTPLTWWGEKDPGILDITYGSLDRECLDNVEMKPERHMMWGLGLGWVKELVERWDPRGERHEGEDLNVREVVKSGAVGG